MPFTFSHPAAILPLRRFPKYFSMTALVAGSIVPDFEYFFRMDIISRYSHNVWGMFWFDMPLAFAFCWIFHYIIKKPLLLNLPVFISGRFTDVWQLDWKQRFLTSPIVVLFSLLIGIISHILWDSFTHRYGFFVDIFPQLERDFKIFNFPITYYSFFQHISTVIGGIILIVYIFRLRKDDNSFSHNFSLRMFAFWFFIILCMLIPPIYFYFFATKIYHYKYFIIFGMAGFIAGWLLASLLFSLFNRNNRNIMK